MKLEKEKLIPIIRSALKEDIGPLDVTTTAVIPKSARMRADILTKIGGIVCGLPICEAIFELLDRDIKFKPQVNEGDSVNEGKVLCYLEGPARPILTGERTALNFLGRLSGIATETRKFVEKAEPYDVRIMDTRKTTPGLRYLEKYAVRVGGGYNHRMGLWDQVLVKDNHLKAVNCQLSAVSKLLKDIRKKIQKNTKIEIEVESLKEFEEALKGSPDIIMLDNMKPEDVKAAVNIRNKKGRSPLLEVSGKIDIENIEEHAKQRPDIISVGTLTHSAKSLDVSLDVYASA
ncbi:MAG: carboxylating nicotinate-nucleotide diphosphorylase [Candidatus Omnitrophica bacterium]|nr:carboxylating nicotinate-nucleotide diphosphorylase [Candidatus Omnitrophota bacterium]